MISYRASDVILSWDHDSNDYREQNWPRTCGYVKEEAENEYQINDDESYMDLNQFGESSTISRYLNHSNDHLHNDTNVRKKRQADQYEYTPTKTRCPLLLVADYRFYQEMGGSNTKTTINYLVG